jgi:CDP-glycerol glycerophosphotransferase (TagB/SpsB family)
MSFISKITTSVDIALTKPIFLLSKLIPRQANSWVFIGWHKGPHGEIFADNCKYLFLYTSENVPEINAIWLAKDKTLAEELTKRGYKSVPEKSLIGIWTALRAGTTIVDATLQRFNARWTGTTRLVQLLHGKGMKKGSYSEKLLRPYDYIFNTSEYANDLLPDSLKNSAKVLIPGYSRHTPLFSAIKDADLGSDTLSLDFAQREKTKGRKVILYAPTFRRGMKELPIQDFLPLETLSKWLDSKNISLIINLHPKYRMQAKDIQLPHITFANDGDSNTLLPHIDLLITDYSSIFTDYLLLDRPMVFYAFDLKDYSEREGIAIEYNDVPGEIAADFSSLLQAVERGLHEDPTKEKRRASCDLYHLHKDGKASERIISELTK